MCIGNPIRAEGKFVDLIRQAPRHRADNVPPRLAVNTIRIPSTESPHAYQEKSEFGLADRTWLESMYRKHGKGSLKGHGGQGACKGHGGQTDLEFFVARNPVSVHLFGQE